MNELAFWMPALIGLGGALIGAGASIITVAIQSKRELKKGRTALVAELAIKETDHAYRMLRDAGGRGVIPPAVVYMHYYDRILQSIDSGKFNGDSYREICRENRGFIDLCRQVDAEKEAEEEGNEAYRQAHEH